jgi:hypothetical protein
VSTAEPSNGVIVEAARNGSRVCRRDHLDRDALLGERAHGEHQLGGGFAAAGDRHAHGPAPARAIIGPPP